MSDLIVFEQISTMEIFTNPEKMDDVIGDIRKKVDDFEGDMTTAKGRKEIASFAHKIARTKTAVDNSGKELTEDVRAKINLINAERNRVKSELQKMQDAIRKPLTDWENAEKDRVNSHNDAILNFSNYLMNHDSMTSKEIYSLVISAQEFHGSRDWQEFAEKAEEKLKGTIEVINHSAANAEKQESERAELERLRKEYAEREQKERDERIAREAAENARIEAERIAMAEREEIERKARAAEKERVEAERKVQEAELKAQYAAENERRRIEAEKQAEIEAEKKRESDKAHKSKINNEALSAIMSLGIDEDRAKSVISEIAKGKIPHIKITY